MDWVCLGVERCLSRCVSGRELLARMNCREQLVAGTTLFESLNSARRHALCRELTVALQRRLAQQATDPFAAVDAAGTLCGFDLYAGDGHFHAAACHDPGQVVASATRRAERVRHHPVAHFYALNLRTQALSHLSLADQSARDREHDMRALKRLCGVGLRQGAATGRKVLYVWDRAGIDFRFWHQLKHGHAVYFLSRSKDNMRPEVIGEHRWDRADPVNVAVLADQEVSTSQGVSVRRVTFQDVQSGVVFEFLTNLPVTVPPGLVALLYRRRWDIEKVFDQIKHRLGQTKAWATRAQAKINQAQIICLTHNLLTLFELHLASQELITNQAELRRKANRLKAPDSHPLAQHFQRLTVRTLKLIRWVDHHLRLPTPWRTALASLSRLYAAL
jgi:hypothetical protein